VQDWTKHPAHYGAVHFHSDDLTDARWPELLTWRIPADLQSGIYAIKLRKGEDDDRYVPFFVRPSANQRKAQVAFLVPTATYLAYADNRFAMYAAELSGRSLTSKDAVLKGYPEIGLSLYDRHADGSGVHYSSRRRPILDLSPCEDGWGFTADTNITAWLHESGISFDVVTDEDLHNEGTSVLSPYRVIITGTHPEYASTRMLDGIEGYLSGGGRLMYMGGNGFYWRVAYDPEDLAVIELRRAEGRGRAWDSEPGEYYLSFSGEYGGLWRLLGRPPNRLVGIGFTALGQDDATRYQRQPAADDPRANFVFAGNVFGGYGSMCGGAVSQEVDSWNPLLGSPRHALVLATSVPPSGDFILCREEIDASYPGVPGPKLRADMVFFETPGAGAVFSTGSIGFAGALAHNSYANDINRIAQNVLLRFADPEPFSFPHS
jgi:N,N-dimethylformamidase